MAQKKGDSTSTILAAHSRAKVELFKVYLGTYLNILERAEHINHLNFFDLCAGEGLYADGGKGSPVMIMETIREHYFANKKQCIPIDVYFNDPGMSQIEPGRLKIDRVKEAVEKPFRPSTVNVHFAAEGYTEILCDVKRQANGLKSNERAIVFIDPWGYKDIKPDDLIELMQNKRTEVLLFLPTADMHRFADKSLSDEDFPGGRPLRNFLQALYRTSAPDSTSSLAFADSLLKRFRLLPEIRFADKFTLERDKGRYFCLYFFTSHPLGLQKMVEAKWAMDEKNGRGFTLPNPQGDLFDGYQHSDYPDLVKAELFQRGGMTNAELKLFGLELGYLPKHSKELLQQWKDQGILEVEALDELSVKGFYLDNDKRRIKIKLK
ncbi:MAG: three-Cys-motif partner protein TcmP [Flavobacteriales bacterium]|nr:three-Cys-motif partner protein TcmP [Flavobacteriales bacterium]